MSTAEQWETATVRVEDIQSGDQISFGGVWLPVERVSVRDATTDVIFEPGLGEIALTTLTEVEVRRRPTADSELVEIMAKAQCERVGFYWVTSAAAFKECVRKDTYAAIAAARAAGYRIERAS